MTLSHLSSRLGLLAGAALTSALFVFAAPQAHAAGNNARFYTVELAEPAAAQRTIVRGVVFNCEGTTCRAPASASAARNVCASVARELGEVKGFTAGDKAFEASALDSCNQKKKVIIAKD
ncbi:CC_3452 family protein [Sphingorhabdus sp.]|jgi:hypothetical protein|uniref:CC_3452 family protein n=1 Tax=Sphingorhabdus sp. TaxID=1902408 RepID=UPI003BB16130|nr:hypothetical protein [Sphingomonadales bacterium]MBK9432060.1 hypothetical protein [Sphingomonadales bacterium]MBL0023413.1 hypothetical protein [Sphingomonadales bacterium]